MAASKVNVGNRTPEADKEARNVLIDKMVEQGGELGKGADGPVVVTKAFGLTVVTRV